MRYPICLCFLFLMILCPAALADDTPDVDAPDMDKLTGIAKRTHAELDAIDEERDAVIKDVRDQRLSLERRAREWANEPLDAEKTGRLEKDIEYTKNSIASLQLRLAELEQRLAIAGETDLGKRKAKAADLEAKASVLRAQEREQSKPFDDRRREVRNSVSDEKDAFSKGMAAYFKGTDGVSVSGTMANLTTAFTSVTWADQQGKRVAWAHVLVTERPELGDEVYEEKYPIISESSNSLWVQAGPFEVRFIVQKEEWRTKEQVRKLLKQHVDLTAMTKVKPTPTE